MTKKTNENRLPSNHEDDFLGNEYLGVLSQSLKAHSPTLCSIVIDLNSNKYTTVSNYVLDLVCGRICYSHDKPLFDSVPIEEYKVMVRRSEMTRSFMRSMIDVEDVASLSIIEDYHVRLNGKDLLVTQKFMPLKVNNEGKITVGLLLITPSVNSSFGELMVFWKKRMWRYDECTSSFVEKEKPCVSESEKRLLLLSISGFSVKDIALHLSLSENTVKTKRRRLFKKLGVKSLMAAMTKMDCYSLW